MRRKIRVGIAEDHEVLRQGLIALFKAQGDIRTLFDVSNGAELLEALRDPTKPDVILLDLDMPAVDGRQALKLITQRYPDIKVIILSQHTQLDFINECIALGAHGFLSKDCDFDKILDAISAAVFKGFYFDDVVSKALVADVRNKRNTVEITQGNLIDTIDIQIIQLICQGFSNKKIAKELFLSERTIEGRRLRISNKTGTNNVVELVIYAIKHGIFRIYD